MKRNSFFRVIILSCCILLLNSCGKSSEVKPNQSIGSNYISLAPLHIKKIAVICDSERKSNEVQSLSESILRNKNYQLISYRDSSTKITYSNAIGIGNRLGVDGIVVIELTNFKTEQSQFVRVNNQNLHAYTCNASARLVDCNSGTILWNNSKEVRVGDSVIRRISDDKIILEAVNQILENFPIRN